MDLPDRWLFLPSGSSVVLGLQDYRYVYRSYRSDAQLQRLLEKHTFIITPDDHETANDCYWDYVRDTLGAPDHPYVDDAGALRQLKLDSQRAWLEYVPTRVTAQSDERHPHDYSQVYRGFDFGDLVRISLLDTRSYRTPHPCGEGDIFERYLPIGCSAYSDTDQTLLGADQKRWLSSQLTGSRALWNVLGNQTLVAPLKLGYGSGTLPINVDAWDGYQAERSWLTETLKDNKVRNTVVLTGDMHSYVASHLLRDFDNLNPFDTANILGVEFMTPSVTSSNLFETLAAQLGGANQHLIDGLSEAAIRLNNPHIQHFNSSQYGYSTVEFRRDRCDWTAYAVDKNGDPNTAGVTTVARLRKYTWWPWLVQL
jgi:alkaline phosphatase D